MSLYIIVCLFNGKMAPIGMLFYSLEEARKKKEDINSMQVPTIIEISPDKPPMVVM